MTIWFCSDFGAVERTQLGEEHMNENIMTQEEAGGEKKEPNSATNKSIPLCMLFVFHFTKGIVLIRAATSTYIKGRTLSVSLRGIWL